MKVLFALLVIICFCCQKRSVPVVRCGSFGNMKSPEHSLQIETFKLGKGDTLYRKVVLDSSWIEK